MERIVEKCVVEKVIKETVCDICGRVFNPYSEEDDDDREYSMSGIWMNVSKEANYEWGEGREDNWYHYDMCYKCFRDKFMVWMKESFGANPQTDRMD